MDHQETGAHCLGLLNPKAGGLLSVSRHFSRMSISKTKLQSMMSLYACRAMLDRFENFGFEEQDAAASFDVGKALVHPVVEGDKGDVEIGGDLFAGEEGLVVPGRSGGRFCGECGEFFAEDVADPAFDLGFGRDDEGFHGGVTSGFLIVELS
jgi:hypothetical protein